MTSSYTPTGASNNNTTAAGEKNMPETPSLSQKWMSGIRIPESAKRQPLVNANQQTSINAMIAYISHQSGKSEFGIERHLADYFHIPNATMLQASDFDRAIRYLADMFAA